MEDNFSMDEDGGGWFGDDSSTLHILCNFYLCTFICAFIVEVLSPPLGEAALKVCLAAAAAQGGLTAFVCSGGTCYVGQDR